LQALAFEVLGQAPSAGAWSTGDMLRELAGAAGSRGVVGGQVADIALTAMAPTAEQIAYVHLHKTADLFRAALRLGAMAAGGTSAQMDALTRYAVNLGLAFQMTDDLLDAPESGHDPVEASCLSVYDRDDVRTRVTALIHGAVSALDGCDLGASEALAAVARHVAGRTH
jgi:geranylgeranyl diphosphate synthase type II